MEEQDESIEYFASWVMVGGVMHCACVTLEEEEEFEQMLAEQAKK